MGETRSESKQQIILRFDKNSERDMKVYTLLKERDQREYPGYLDFFCDAVLTKEEAGKAERPVTRQELQELFEKYLGKTHGIPGK